MRSPTASVLGIGRDRMDPRTVSGTDETVTAANQVAPRFTFFFLWPAGIRKRKKNIEVILSISFNYMALIVTYKRGSIY